MASKLIFLFRFPPFPVSHQDLEEQSRLIAASSRANQSSGDGQFVVLSSSQSEDSDLGEDGKKKRESEAWGCLLIDMDWWLYLVNGTSFTRSEMQVEGLLYYRKDFTIYRPYYALIFLSRVSDFHSHVHLISVCQMTHGDATMFMEKRCFLKASLQYGKSHGVFSHWPLCAIALEAKLPTLLGLQQYTETCSLLETKADVHMRQCYALADLLHITVLRFRKKNPY